MQISAFGPIKATGVGRMLEGSGLTCCASHVSYDRLKDDLLAVIDEHHLRGCRHVAIGSMPRPFREAGATGVRRLATEVNAIGRELVDAGLTLSYHNHSFEFVRARGTTLLDLLFEETDPRYLTGSSMAAATLRPGSGA